VTNIRAFLVDVYETLLAYDADARFAALAGIAEVDPAGWRESQLSLRGPRDRGEVTSAESFARSLAACGADPTPELVATLVKADREFMLAYAPLYDDAVPFLKELRARDFAIALVSNCADSTRPLLRDLDLLPLADQVILSCEVHSAKPSPEIFRIALDALGVPADAAVMIDDQPGYLRGAVAAGVRGIQIDRGTEQPDPAFTPVRSLLDIFAVL
jgi:HAD superfamily hydrolase (TIGR01509 family)